VNNKGQTDLINFVRLWREFEAYVHSLEYFLVKEEYCGVKLQSYESIIIGSERDLEDLFEDEEESVESYNKKIREDLYLLPTDEIFKTIDELLIPDPVPKAPKLIDAPPIEHPYEKPSINFSAYQKERYRETREKRQSLISKEKKLRALLENKNNEMQNIYDEYLNVQKGVFEGAMRGESGSTEKLLMMGYSKNRIKTGADIFQASETKPFYSVGVDTAKKIVVIEFDFPNYSEVNIISGYKKPFKINPVPIFYSDKEKNRLVRLCLYSISIRTAFLAGRYCVNKNYETVVVNVSQNWFDASTGQPKRGVIASLQASVDFLKQLDLSKLNPEVCFKTLKGISTSSISILSPVRPIMVLNRTDKRIVPGRDIESELDEESNLALMDWQDFEHLVAQLFEWEFVKQGVEVKVTRASRDSGVDAILFDPDPLRGGKYVLQAKRYTRTVDVSAVRDLYGTVMNEGANRGILITTAGFGPDAYEFAKDKNLSLVDGTNLLIMLQKHGKKYRIDLKEARKEQQE
jgi:restriction system protein